MTEKIETEAPEFGCPTLTEMMMLYADLAEPTDYRALQETINANAQDPEHNPVVVVRSKDKKLVGFLLAWTDGAGHGIVNQIAIHPSYQRRELAKRLLHHLETQKRGEWKGNSQRITANLDRHLVVVRTMYAVALAFGFQKVVDSSYTEFLRHFSQPMPGDRQLPALSGITIALVVGLFAAIGLLGIRFFWATGNIRRFLLQRVIVKKPPKTRDVLLCHFPILILHAVLFFFLCRFYQDICLNGLKPSYVYGLVLIFVILMALNVSWLTLLRRKRTDPGPELLWIRNNAGFAALGAAYLILFHRFGSYPELSLLIALALMLANSAIDLVAAGRSYILGDSFGGG